MRTALIIVGHMKPAWNELSEEEQAGFAARVGRTARKAGVVPVVGYKLSTQGSFLEIWEAEQKELLEAFVGALDALGSRKYYDQVLMIGERAENWIASQASQAGDANAGEPERPPAPRARAGRTRSGGAAGHEPRGRRPAPRR